jgi:hypothetical protein
MTLIWTVTDSHEENPTGLHSISRLVGETKQVLINWEWIFNLKYNSWKYNIGAIGHISFSNSSRKIVTTFYDRNLVNDSTIDNEYKYHSFGGYAHFRVGIEYEFEYLTIYGHIISIAAIGVGIKFPFAQIGY